MIEVTDNYALYAAGASQATVYVLELTDLGVYLSTGAVVGLSGARELLMERPPLVPTQVDPLAASSGTGSVSVQVLDLDGYLTGLRRSAEMRGQPAVLYIGYEGLPWADYLAAFPGRVNKWSRAQNRLAYRIDLVDVLDSLDEPLFSPAALAAEPFTVDGKSFDSGSLILYDTDGDSIYDRVVLQGNPVELALKLLLSGGGAGSTWDVWPAWAGAGLAEDQVDVAWCEAERDTILTVEFQISVSGEEDPKRFIEQEICLPLGGYLLVSGTGKIRLQFASSPSALAATVTVTDQQLIADSLTWGEEGELYVSGARFEMDYDGSNFGLIYEKASPQFLASARAEVRIHNVVSRGLQTSLGGVSIADAVADALFSRYGQAPPRVSFDAFFSRHLAEAGDILSLTSEAYPDWDDRGAGSERLLLVLSAKPGPQKVSFDAIDLTGAISAGTRALIAPESTPDWTSATAADKAYAFIGDQASGQFSDGTTNPYVWG